MSREELREGEAEIALGQPQRVQKSSKGATRKRPKPINLELKAIENVMVVTNTKDGYFLFLRKIVKHGKT